MPKTSINSGFILSWTVYLILVFWMAALLANLQTFDTLVWVAVTLITAVVACVVGLVIQHGLRRSDNTCRSCTDVGKKMQNWKPAFNPYTFIEDDNGYSQY